MPPGFLSKKKLRVSRETVRHSLDTKLELGMPYQNYFFRNKVYMANHVNQVLGLLLLHPIFTDVRRNKHCTIKMILQPERMELIALAMFVAATTVEVKSLHPRLQIGKKPRRQRRKIHQPQSKRHQTDSFRSLSTS